MPYTYYQYSTGGGGGGPVDTSLPVYTLATLPAASSNANKLVRVSNVGVNDGSVWVSDGTNWNPVGPICLANNTAPYTASTYTTEEIAVSILLPAGLLKDGNYIDMNYALNKSGSTDVFSRRVRFGSAGSISDAQMVALSVSATHRNSGHNTILQRGGATAMRILGHNNAVSPFGTMTSGYAGDITVNNMDTTDSYLSLSFLKTGGAGGETLQVYSYSVYLYRD